ncbi:MAG: hypothetical protein ACYS1A_18145 [Planctomycetota bacterium]|jgi:hypothetical protein
MDTPKNTPNNSTPNFTTAPDKLLSDPDLTPFDKIVWLCIKRRQGRNPYAWPSEETIAKDAGDISIASVKRSVKHLQETVWLKVEKPPKQGRGQTNKYAVLGGKKGIRKNPFSQKGYHKETRKGITKRRKVYKGKYIHSPTSEEARLSGLLLNLILERKPNFTHGQPNNCKQTIQRWAVHIDRLIRLNNRTPEEVEAVIRWCQQDDFWQNNILCTEKLRKQIDQLELKMQKQVGQITAAPLQRGPDGRTPREAALAQERTQNG